MLSIPKIEKTIIATDPFKATSNKDSIGMQEAIKYTLEIAVIASKYEILSLKHCIKK